MARIKYFETNHSLHINDIQNHFISADDYCAKTKSRLDEVLKLASTGEFTLFAASKILRKRSIKHI